MSLASPFSRRYHWLLLTLALILTLVEAPDGQVLPGAMVASGGGGISPGPPQAKHRTATAPPVDLLSLPLHVAVLGQASSYTVIVTSPSGAIVASGTTNAQGMIQLMVPAMIGLELDVLDTTVVGLPVAGGQAILITIP